MNQEAGPPDTLEHPASRSVRSSLLLSPPVDDIMFQLSEGGKTDSHWNYFEFQLLAL